MEKGRFLSRFGIFHILNMQEYGEITQSCDIELGVIIPNNNHTTHYTSQSELQIGLILLLPAYFYTKNSGQYGISFDIPVFCTTFVSRKTS